MAMAFGDNNVEAAKNGNVICNLRFSDDTLQLQWRAKMSYKPDCRKKRKNGHDGQNQEDGVQYVGPERVNIEIKIGSQKLKQVQDFVYERQRNKTLN